MPTTVRTHCCYIGQNGATEGESCGYDAEYEICTANGGPDPASDLTHACRLHVGLLLGHQPDCANPDAVFWQVYPLE